MGSTDVYSPALYPASTRVWDDAGFQRFHELAVMERDLDHTLDEPAHSIGLVSSPDWDELAVLDREAFSGFWRMGALGLAEAMIATPRSALFQIEGDAGPNWLCHRRCPVHNLLSATGRRGPNTPG